MKKMGLLEIKQALQTDSNFRGLFPEYLDDIQKFITDPGCSCNASLYRKIINHQDRIEKYLDGNPQQKIIIPNTKEPPDLYKVITCQVDKLEEKLNLVRKIYTPVTAARHGNEITVILRSI